MTDIEKLTEDKEILKKVIEKAIANGYKDVPMLKGSPEHSVEILDLIKGKRNLLINHNKYYGLIFKHDFAKALWKDIPDSWDPPIDDWTFEYGRDDYFYNRKAWEYHLGRMVLEENPIQYLKQFISK